MFLGHHHRHDRQEFLTESTRSKGGVDALSAVLSACGLGLAAFGIVEGRSYGWIMSTQPRELFGVRGDSGSSTQEPLMNMKLFSIASFRNGNIATVIIGLGGYGIIAVLPLWLQFTLDFVAWWPDANWRSDRFSGQASFSLDSSGGSARASARCLVRRGRRVRRGVDRQRCV